jgi:putative flippase GtrA
MTSTLVRRQSDTSAVLAIVRFAAVGVLNTAVDVGLFLLLVRALSVPTVVANSVSYSAGVLNSFLLNKYWTFGRVRQTHPFGRQLVLFISLNLVGLLISNAVVTGLHRLGPGPAKLISIPIVFAWNFWTSRRVVYRDSGA